jgi:hypothetical protein
VAYFTKELNKTTLLANHRLWRHRPYKPPMPGAAKLMEMHYSGQPLEITKKMIDYYLEVWVKKKMRFQDDSVGTNQFFDSWQHIRQEMSDAGLL